MPAACRGLPFQLIARRRIQITHIRKPWRIGAIMNVDWYLRMPDAVDVEILPTEKPRLEVLDPRHKIRDDIGCDLSIRQSTVHIVEVDSVLERHTD
jgi:hypothetical protein